MSLNNRLKQMPNHLRRKWSMTRHDFKTIEAQLASILAALKIKEVPKDKQEEAPSYYGAWDESFCGMGEAAYVTTRAQTHQEAPRGATSGLDPQVGEAHQ